MDACVFLRSNELHILATCGNILMLEIYTQTVHSCLKLSWAPSGILIGNSGVYTLASISKALCFLMAVVDKNEQEGAHQLTIGMCLVTTQCWAG